MKHIFSVFFNIDRTYATLMEVKEKGLELKFIDSTRTQIDLENISSSESVEGIRELHQMIEQNKDSIESINVAIPAEIVFVTQFPGASGMSNDELNQLVNLEIKQAFPQFNSDEFSSNIIPMEPAKDGSSMMMAAIIQREILDAIKEIFINHLPVQNIEVSQLGAHTSFLYNYPENAEKTNIVFGIQEQFIDVSVIKNAKPAYYNLLSISSPDKIGELFEEEYNKIIANFADQVDGAYFFGMGLTKEIYFQVWETAMAIGIMETGRLNAFRMVETTLDQRRRDYCSRMMHVLPPCVGSTIPAYHQTIPLY